MSVNLVEEPKKNLIPASCIYVETLNLNIIIEKFKFKRGSRDNRMMAINPKVLNI